MLQLRQLFVDLLIRILERELYRTPVGKALEKEQYETFYANLFDVFGFKQYCIERETRFVHALADTNTPEIKGQRVENMILFQKAKGAHERRVKKSSLAKGAASTSPSRE